MYRHFFKILKIITTKMKKLIGTTLFLAMGMAAQAQQPFQHRCAYDHAVQQRDQQFPGYKAAVDAVFAEAQRLGTQQQGRSTYVVPVAVHVVWKEPVEMLPECKVIEQIEILNEDYNRMNADAANLRAIFQGIAGNPSIEFRLDTIIWKQTSTLFYSTSPFPDITVTNKVKKSADGGSDALATDQYLNIWMCNMGTSGVLGFAYPPAGLANWPADSEAPTPQEEGVVLDYRVVGRYGEYTQQGTTLYTQGRAASHEVGHYLGLRHIWGDGLSAIFGIPDCSATDGVADTPTQGIGSQFACDTTQNTCGAGTAGDLPDMIENFMDYSTESCQNSFTQGQIAIMHGVLTAERANLANTPAPMTTRPANNTLPEAELLTVNLDATCAVVAATTTLNATPSQSACSGTLANDVWYTFTAPAADLVLELSNVSSTDSVGYELLSGSCGDLTSIDCAVANGAEVDNMMLTGLTTGETYYLRIATSTAVTLDLCVRTAQNIASANEANAWKGNVLIFPNPSSGLFTVQLPALAQGEGMLRLNNALGQQIGQSIALDKTAAASNVQLDLSQQAAGLYWLEMRWNGEVVAFPLVVTK